MKNISEANYYKGRDELLKDPKLRKIYNEEMLKLEIAAEIRKLRKKKKISQSELAKKINTTQAVISRIENAQVYPSTDIIQRICNTFKVKVKFKFC
mgnify:CR=1 FL=1